MQRHKNVSSSSGSVTDSGVDLRAVKKERAFDMTKNSLNFPVDGKPLLLPEKDKSSRTKHLSHLPNVRIAAQNPTSRPKSHSRSYSHSSSTPSATLVRLLRAQESTTKETKALLNVALSQLDSASARAAKAEAQISARETASLLSHTQLTENAARAEEAASRARREAQNYKLQLWLKDEEIRKERERVRAEEHMRAEAEKEAERARSLARKWRGEGRILKAKEEGRREGYGEGLKRGRLVIAAAVAASESGYGDRRLVGDGAAYIEEYDDAPFNQPRRRREQSRSRGTRSRKSEPGSTAPPSRRERVDPSFTRPSPSEMVQYQSPPPAEPVQEPIQEPPPPSISESSSIIRRARSIQVDSPLFQPERTNSALSSRSRQLQTVVLSPPENHPTQTQIFVHESPPPPLPPPVFPEPAPTIPEPEPEVYTFPTPDVPLILEQQQPPDSTPIPIPPPISQVPFAPGILPTAPSTFPHHAQYAAPKPEPQPPFQPTYFPMPAPPVQVIITPAEEDRDVQTPSTMTSMTNENSLNGLGFLSDFPAVTSVAGSAVSVGSGGSTGLNRADGGRFDPDFLSTIHEHSREGTAFGGEEDGTARGMSPRYVDQWRRSLGGQPYSPGGNSGNDLLRPPSSTSNPNSRRRRPSALNLDVELDRQLSSGSTSSRSININVEPPSRPTSPSSDPRNHQNDRFHRGDQDYHYGYTENEHPPQDEAFLSPHHAPLTLSAEHDEGPVIPSIKEESDEDDYDDHDYPNSRSLNSGSSSPVQLYPLSIVDSLPPGFVPTPNGGHLISLQQQHKLRDGSHPGQIASVGYVSGIGGGGQPRGVPGGFYAHANNPNAHDQNGRHPYGVSSIRGDGDDYSRTGSSSSRSSSAAGSSLSTELGRPNKYPRSKGGASNRRRSRALTSTFPPTTMSDGGYDSNKEYGNGDGNTLGGIYAMPAINPNSLNRGTLRDMSQYGSVGNVPAAAAIGGSSRMSMSMPEPSLPQYGHSSMPEPSVPQYPYNSEATRYSTPRGDTSRSVPMPEPAVPLYPSTGPSGSSLEGQRNIGLGAGGRQRSLKRTKGAVSRVGMDMPEPSVPQYRTSNARGYGTQSPGDSRGGSRMTPAAVSMPDPSVPQYNVPNQGYAGVYQTPGGGSRMVPAAGSMPDPSVPQYNIPSQGYAGAYQTPGGDSRMIPPAVSMPEPTVTGYPANVHQTPGAANASSRITPAAMPMPEPNVLPQHDQYPTYGMPGYHTPTPGGGTAGASRMVSPEMSMPEPSVGSSTVAGTGVPADGTSRMTAPAMIMPEPSVDSTVSVKGITAGGTSRMTAPVVPMPNHSVGLAANGTPARVMSKMTAPVVPMPEPSVGSAANGLLAGGVSRMTVPVVPMPEPHVGSTANDTPAGGVSRMTAPVIPMPEPSVGSNIAGNTPAGRTSNSRMTVPVFPMPEPSVSSTLAGTPSGGISRMTAPVIPMPEPSVSHSGASPLAAEPFSMMPGSFTPGRSSSSSGPRFIPPAIPMPEPTVPQHDSEAGSQDIVSMPEPSVPQFGVNAGSSPAREPISRITAPAVPMPEPTVPRVVHRESTATPADGESRMTAPAMSMPEPAISAKALSKTQKKKQKKKGGISMPEPEVPQYNVSSTAQAGSSSVITMPEPSVPSFDTQSIIAPSGGASRMIPPTIPMPEPSSNVTAPMIPMPVPNIGTPLSMGGNVLPPSSPSMSTSGWGIGGSGGWGLDAGAGGSGGFGSPNMSNQRMSIHSMHAGTTPVTVSQPLPVPNPIPGPLRKGLGIKSIGSSPASSVDSTTRKNTEANKGSKGLQKSARARGMTTSAWGS